MSKVIDVRGAGGDFVVLGKALVLPSSSTDGDELPLDGSIRFNPTTGSAEVFSNETWSPLGSGGEGGVLNHTHSISQVIGLVDALAQKSSLIHMHPFAEVNGLQAALNAKAASVHLHSIAQVTGLQPVLDGLQATLDAKASTTHTHSIAAITGLQSSLDAKAPVNHQHAVDDIPVLASFQESHRTIQYTAHFTGTIAANQTYIIPITHECTIPSNFEGSVAITNVRPESVSRQVNIFRNLVQVGTLTLMPGSESETPHSFITNDPDGVTFNVGDYLAFNFEDNTDPALNTLSIGVLAKRPIQ